MRGALQSPLLISDLLASTENRLPWRCSDRGLSTRRFAVRIESAMNETSRAWDGEQVRKWLESRLGAARLEQAAADKRGYEAQDDYDKAAAEEWVCRALKTAGRTDNQAEFAAQLKTLLAQDEYRITGIYDDRRFDRHVRATLRKITKMTKANDGFANTLRYQG